MDSGSYGYSQKSTSRQTTYVPEKYKSFKGDAASLAETYKNYSNKDLCSLTVCFLNTVLFVV